MEILSEIIEVSDSMMNVLEENGFFTENPFIEVIDLKRSVQTAMQRKWEQNGEMLLTDKEFLYLCNEEIKKSVDESLQSLFQKGAINMSIGDDGEILYSANPDFDINKLNED